MEFNLNFQTLKKLNKKQIVRTVLDNRPETMSTLVYRNQIKGFLSTDSHLAFKSRFLRSFTIPRYILVETDEKGITNIDSLNAY